MTTAEYQSDDPGKINAAGCQARIWYLDHSTWLVQTGSRFLLFDYGDYPPRPASGTQDDGRLDLAGLASLPLYAFSSHRHGDHYSLALQRTLSTRPQSMFFLGLDKKPSGDNTRAFTEGARLTWPRGQFIADDLVITCSGSTDSGVSFLVEAPEGVFYHGGDLAVWDDTRFFRQAFRQEIDFLAERIEQTGRRPDLAFLAVSTSDGYQEDALLEGVAYAAQKLRPKLLVPMHAHGFEELYSRFAGMAKGDGWPPVKYVSVPGSSLVVDLEDSRK
jgi:L-ascorbate metabolism protein UlaG (beta-lactamase superfamily)